MNWVPSEAVLQTLVSTPDPALAPRARALADELQLEYSEVPVPGVTLLQLSAAGLQLLPGEPGMGPVAVDFGAGAMRHRRRGGHSEPLGRAVGVNKRPGLSVVDATAGLGRDSFVLADLGCAVSLVERSPLVFALLRDGISRAAGSDDPWLRQVAGRMALYLGDSASWLAGLDSSPDVIYLDPMFPARKKSARVKKEMWLFQHLLTKTQDEAELLAQALSSASWRVVVKRPARAEPLNGEKPHHAIEGKTVRFDVYSCP